MDLLKIFFYNLFDKTLIELKIVVFVMIYATEICE